MKSFIKWYRQRQLRRMVDIAIKVLKSLERIMVKANYSRQQRREIWRNLAKSREEVIEYLGKTLNYAEKKK